MELCGSQEKQSKTLTHKLNNFVGQKNYVIQVGNLSKAEDMIFTLHAEGKKFESPLIRHYLDLNAVLRKNGSSKTVLAGPWGFTNCSV